MIGDKLIQVQRDVNELINDTIPKGNKIALITFNDIATIVNDFTDDATLLQESINNLTVAGETNYYQALVKVDDLLSTYNKESNRDCVVLFLTDGLPTVDTPSEVGEYKLLKDKYKYLSINGIQYEFGTSVFDGVKNITDIQFVATKESLNEFLYKASISPASYDSFILTDYIDTDNFNLNNINNITTTFGSASIESNKVIWNLDGFKTGLDAELTIDINLNDDLIGVGGIYPTHTKTDVSYKIDSINTTESSTKTTILKDNYVVIYEDNAPAGCIVSGIPSSKIYSVFDTVKIIESVPTCIGYQFEGWEIVTDDVEKISDNQFIMPESNVIIKAIWRKLSINKAMNGTISNAQSLYKYIASNTIGLDSNIDFSKVPTDSDSGIYTMNSTKDDKYPVYYYRGIIDDNNVLFAGFCWEIVRTTSTGGVKLIYNGLPSENYNILDIVSSDSYINISNDATYPYTYDTSTNRWTSTNKTNSATGTMSFSISVPGTYILSYSVSSEINYDEAYFYRNGNQIGVYSGTESGTIMLENLVSSDVIMVKYTKDSSGSSGSDTVSFSINETDGIKITSCNNTGVASQIGKTYFNSDSESPRAAGYMYGKEYAYSYYDSTGIIYVLNRESTSSSSNYYYGNSVIYSNGTYTLQNAEQKSWTDNYSSLKGYYTCRSTSTTCSKVYYIVGTDSSTQYTLSLSAGETDPATQTITLGKGVTDNGDGTYSLTDAVTIKKSDWYTKYWTYKNYYICKDLTSTICDKIYSVAVSTNNYEIRNDSTFNYVYGNDVSWDGTKYTLTDTYTSPIGWSTDKTTLAKKYHYTCLNTTGECTEVYYIYYFDDFSNRIFYLTMSSGKNIEDAKNEMFTNTTDSTVKEEIDSWYKINMIDYTDKLEDTVWCNDRTLHSGSLAGKDIDAGTEHSYFGAFARAYYKYNPSINCPNEERDGFTVSTLSGGNGKLTYPVGLLTADEIVLAGANTSNKNFYLYTGEDYNTLSPFSFQYYGMFFFTVYSSGGLHSSGIPRGIGVRPSISLAPGTRYIDGDGTVDDPFIIGD